MIRKSLFTFFLIAAVSTVAFAQTAPVRGIVEMTQADGKKVPVVGASVEVYRTDIKGKFPGAKTDKKGVFTFAGLPLGGVFTLAISGAGISPELYPNVKAGREDIAIMVNAGDGRKFTEDEVRSGTTAITAKSGSGELSAEQKKALAEEQKKIDAVKQSNVKIEDANKLIVRVYNEGNQASDAKNYDVAIAKYSEGLAADSDHPGTPALLIGKANAYKNRGVERYNVAIKSGGTGIEAAKQDFLDAAVTSKATVDLLKTATPPTDTAALANFNGYKYNSQVVYAESMRLVASKVDQSRVDEMVTAYQGYFTVETDPLKKAKTQLVFAQALMDSQAFDKAAVEFEKVLVDSPNDPNALYGAGLCFINLGYISEDKTKLQTGANYVARFVEISLDTDKRKAEMKETLETLKKLQNVTAQKPTKTPTKTPTTKKKP